MKKIFFPIAAIATLLVASCAKEEILEPTGSQVQTKTVLSAGIQTKTVLENDAQVLWTNGDKINVNGVTREMTTEEVAEYEQTMAEMSANEPTTEERIAELEEALALLLSGVTE